MQIAGNLISNAIKFTPAGGTVTVDLKLAITLETPTLRIAVSDTGVGMNAESMEAIMSGSASSTGGTGGEQGFGFGLALVLHLVNSLEGEMSIASDVGKGTTFEVNLPQNIY